MPRPIRPNIRPRNNSRRNTSPPVDYFAYWPLNGNFTDTVGGLNMTQFSGTTTFTTGRVLAQAANFNGNSTLRIPSHATDSLTISCWVYVRTSGTQKIFRSLGAGSQCFGQDSGLWEACGFTGSAVILNQWVNVVVVQGVGAYINGVLDNVNVGASGLDEVAVGSSDGTDEFFDGIIAEMKWYSRALSANEVQLLASS